MEFLETTARKLGEFGEKVRAVETPLQRCEERLEDALSAPPAAAAEAVARLTEQIHALKAPLQVTILNVTNDTRCHGLTVIVLADFDHGNCAGNVTVHKFLHKHRCALNFFTS